MLYLRATSLFYFGSAVERSYSAVGNGGGIAWEAIRRLIEPSPVPGTTIIEVAGVGIIINAVTAFLFMSGRQEDLNLGGAFLHMDADALVSVGVVLAGIAILVTGWLWWDPIISLAIVAVVVVGTWQLLQDSLKLTLDAVPGEIEPLAVETYFAEISGVREVHDLHIWAMSTTRDSTYSSYHFAKYLRHLKNSKVSLVLLKKQSQRQELHSLKFLQLSTVNIPKNQIIPN